MAVAARQRREVDAEGEAGEARRGVLDLGVLAVQPADAVGRVEGVEGVGAAEQVELAVQPVAPAGAEAELAVQRVMGIDVAESPMA